MKKVKKITLAPTSKIDKYKTGVTTILKCLGHPEALVTDESTVGDFLNVFAKTLPPKIKRNFEKVGINEVSANAPIWRLAQLICLWKAMEHVAKPTKQAKPCAAAKRIAKSLEKDPSMDLSDVGNTIGITLSKCLKDEPGWEIQDFLTGVEHGLDMKKFRVRILPAL
jgi:hypothetical protein